MSEFSDFTKLVLDRMETNPDEFEAGNRWDTLVRALEARAIGDFENRYARTLWPLEPLEIEAIMSKYRKLYLARIHKDMLKNIVSGADKEQRVGNYTLTTDINPLTGGVMRGNAVPGSWADAVPKMEGAQITATAYNPPQTSKYTLTKSQAIIADKMGIDPWKYAKRLHQLNGGTE